MSWDLLRQTDRGVMSRHIRARLYTGKSDTGPGREYRRVVNFNVSMTGRGLKHAYRPTAVDQK